MAGGAIGTRYIATAVTIPGGTTQAAPQAVDVAVGDDLSMVESVQLVVPDGHAGLTGIRVEYGGVPIIPWNDPNAWVVTNDEKVVFDVNYSFGRPVTLKAYNLDYWGHSFYLRWKVVDLPTQSRIVSVNMVPIVGAAKAVTP